MPAPPRHRKGLLVAPRRQLAAASAPVYVASLRSTAQLLATARKDRDLAAELLGMDPLARMDAALHERRFHHRTLVRLLVLEVEAALDDPAGADPRPVAELAAMLAAALPRDGQGDVRRAAAWAHWLFGKALLKAGQSSLAEKTFAGMSAFIRHEPSEEAALAAVGLAQVREDTGSIEAAAALYLRSAYGYAQLGVAFPAAACHAQLGMALQASGDLLNAAREMHAALAGMDAAFAPSLAARLWLALAEIEATVGDDDAAGECLRQARTLYQLAATPAEGVERTWREARIAAAAGDGAAADVLLDGVRRELLARGSLAEAARSTWEQLLVRTEGRRWEAADELAAALAGAFPGAGKALAAEMAALARLATEEPQAFYSASLRFGWRLRHQPLGCLEQPRLLTPTRQLADRLLRRRGELEDPIGAAVNL
jgi:hypothetical protein